MAMELMALILMLLNGLDTSLPKDDHLIFTYEPIAQETNGFRLFQQAGKRLVNRDGIDQLVENWNADAANQVCRQNAVALKQWRSGMARPGLQLPEVTDFDTILDYLSGWRALARLASIQARLHAEQGDLETAFGLSMEIIDFGARQENASGCLINYLVGSACRYIGIMRIRQIVHDQQMSTSQLAALDRRLSQIIITPDALKNALRVEYTISRNVVLGSTEDQFMAMELHPQANKGLATLFPLMFKKNATVCLFAQTYGRLLDNASRRVQDRQSIKIKRPQIGRLLRGNFAGEAMHAMLVPTLSQTLERVDKVTADLAFLRLQVALKGYQNAHDQAWPDTLQDLVPQWIDRIPEDPYSAAPAPLKYSKKKHMLYSVGPDGVDNGGATLEQLKDTGPFTTRWRTVEDPSIVLDPALLPKPPMALQPKPPTPPPPRKSLERFDENGDGTVDDREIRKAAEAILERMEAKGLRGEWATFDQDHDGILSDTERETILKSLIQKLTQ